ncbi:MAG: thiamine diphosphokinase [Anaerolineales bacterium]|nr:thiamine diphosphokinase [Anaerolineales bacterium]
MKRVLIFANGELPNLPAARNILQADDYILCADGGTRHALALGLTPNLIIGDLDSLPVDFNIPTTTQVLKFPTDKNETDLELAIQHTLTLNPDEAIILGALGGRLDQTLANIALLANFQLATCNLKINDGVEEIFFCRQQVQVRGRSGDIVSLIPWNGEARGVTTENLKWPLRNETLYPQKTRGISNEMLGGEASVKIESGALLVVHKFNLE